MQLLARTIICTSDSARTGIDALVGETGTDEPMIVSDVFGHQARLRSCNLIAEAGRTVAVDATPQPAMRRLRLEAHVSLRQPRFPAAT